MQCPTVATTQKLSTVSETKPGWFKRKSLHGSIRRHSQHPFAKEESLKDRQTTTRQATDSVQPIVSSIEELRQLNSFILKKVCQSLFCMYFLYFMYISFYIYKWFIFRRLPSLSLCSVFFIVHQSMLFSLFTWLILFALSNLACDSCNGVSAYQVESGIRQERHCGWRDISSITQGTAQSTAQFPGTCQGLLSFTVVISAVWLINFSCEHSAKLHQVMRNLSCAIRSCVSCNHKQSFAREM